MDHRHSGILLHITSLPSKYGIGDMGPFAYAFVDFAASAGQRYWQILPINPTDGINGYSPYSCYSAFAGNPLLISPEMMVIENFLQASDLEGSATSSADDRVDYPKVTRIKEKIFNIAYRRFQKRTDRQDFDRFVAEQLYWLEDFALFTVIKSVYGGLSWNEWPKALKARQPRALKIFARKHAAGLERAKFIQYLFFRQWHKLKNHAHAKSVAIIGDIPIYINYDSAEVWRRPSFFKIDGAGNLKFISGCPPDYFSRTGQRWGNPVYDWAQLKKAGYSWWVERIAHDLQLFDYLRIDHFRGFVGFWQIPAHEKLAVFGRWVKGPGAHFFKTLTKHFRHLPIIAEDLGEITPDVIELMKKFGFPGMRVLLFAFNGEAASNPHVPANYPAYCVAYTGTHDNNTIQGWYSREAKPYEKANIARVLQKKFTAGNLHWTMIEVLMRSRAQTVIISMPDLLGLKEEGRMNTPATKSNNWQWRLKAGALTPKLSQHIYRLTKKTDREGKE
ncbi:MAG: 4-alpha-glucanotransferase [Candidatus Omnitrophica bacterium]|nr:4-alpha-glucanotransferase [Candidatus Omnitrophota bacterium]MDE2008597.1 4-alpha-glucanotransferase [Candidatus Omnitrophota bacterium]MDE2214063.1 4-alpha-glucanotransferase [Candidatus Omnitrophota bacterium]MDE2230959.1 4-alpha-glucanotransferase [Candidatus Omnitrophota bacterium]